MSASGPTARRTFPFLEKVLWATLITWAVAFVGLEAVLVLGGFRTRHVEYLILTSVASLAAVALLSLVGPPVLPRELRRLRVLTVALPVAFIAAVEVSLYALTTEGVIPEPAQHVLATVILSAGVIPLSFYVFSAFVRLRDELAERARRLQALHSTSLAVTKEPQSPRLGELIVEGAREVLPADRMILQLFPPQRAAVVLPHGAALSDWEGELIESVRLGGRKLRARHGDCSALVVPINRGEQVVGALTAVRSAPGEFDAEDEVILDMFAVAAASGLENARRLQEAHLLATVEERERIARDLHDDLGQLLGFLSTKVQAVRELVARGRSNQAAEELAGLERSIRSLGTQVREAILGLRAQARPERPLGEVLQEYAADFGALAGVEVAFDGSPEAGRRLAPPRQYQLFRIAQEALSNARRHAKARRVTVRVAEAADQLELWVADDGAGFQPEAVTQGFGLKTMDERARNVGGTLRVESTPGVGTTVWVRVPVEGR